MRLLILNWRDMIHAKAGGSEVYAQHLAKIWAREHDVTYFTSIVEGAPREETVDGYTVVRAGHRFTVYREAQKFFARSAPYDAILDIINTRPFMTPKWANRTPTVALAYQVARDVWRYEVPIPVSWVGRYVLEPRWLKAYRGTRVLTISDSSAESLRSYGLSNVQVVPVGAEPRSLTQVPAKDAVPTVVWVGRLAPNKRPDHAIEAFKYVRQEIPDARLWIVGDGPMGDRLRRSVPAGVQLLGRVTQSDKQDLMARAHLLTATSVREGWGMTVSEAAALGTQAVTYDVPGLRDSVAAAGGRLAAPDPRSLAQELIGALKSSFWTEAPAHTGVVPWEVVAANVLGELLGGVTLTADGSLLPLPDAPTAE